MSERMNIRLIELLRMCDTPTFKVTIQSIDCIGQKRTIAEKQPLNEIRLTTLDAVMPVRHFKFTRTLLYVEFFHN